MTDDTFKRTDKEILARFHERQADDFFGFEVDEYAICLPNETLAPLCKDGKTPDDYKPIAHDRAAMVERIKGYMPFAWDKACNFRGISASRSIDHFIAWTWLAGDDDLSAKIETPYEHYGKDHLRIICDFYGLDADTWDDGVRVNCESELDE